MTLADDNRFPPTPGLDAAVAKTETGGAERRPDNWVATKAQDVDLAKAHRLAIAVQEALEGDYEAAINEAIHQWNDFAITNISGLLDYADLAIARKAELEKCEARYQARQTELLDYNSRVVLQNRALREALVKIRLGHTSGEPGMAVGRPHTQTEIDAIVDEALKEPAHG